MKIISTESNYLLHESLGLSNSIMLDCGIVFEALEEDAKILLTYPGVIKADIEGFVEPENTSKIELLHTEETELPNTEL